MMSREPNPASDSDQSIASNPYAIGILIAVVVSLALILLVGGQFLFAGFARPSVATTPEPDRNKQTAALVTPTPRVIVAPRPEAAGQLAVPRTARSTPPPDELDTPRAASTGTTAKPVMTFGEVVARLSGQPASETRRGELPVPADDKDEPAVKTESSLQRLPAPGEQLVYEADGVPGLEPMAALSWSMSSNLLTNSGDPTTGQPWTTAPEYSPGQPFAVEAEVQIVDFSDDLCARSFGLVAFPSEIAWGGGVHFACDSASAVAKISDVSGWQAGYDAGRVLNAYRFEPGDDWHTYRLEVRGNDLRMLIDGRLYLKAEDPLVIDGGAMPAGTVGLWSEGVNLRVRRFAIYTIPAVPAVFSESLYPEPANGAPARNDSLPEVLVEAGND